MGRKRAGVWKLVVNDQSRPRVGSVSRIISMAVALFVAFLFSRFQLRRRGHNDC